MEVQVLNSVFGDLERIAKNEKKGMTGKQRAAYLRKCKDYARFLKDDYDFDWTCILALLRYKLERTRRRIAEGNLEGRAKLAAEIQEVEDLLWRVTEHDYEEEAAAAYHKKYGKPKMVTTPHTENTSRIEFIYRNGKPATKAMNREYMRAAKAAEAAQQADLRRAFDLMAENIWGWWD